MMEHAQAQAKSIPPPAQPAAPVSVEKTIEKSVEDAVNQALKSIPSNVGEAERGRLIRDRIRSELERVRAQLEARRNNTSPEIAQLPFNPADVIPPQVVDISVAFFVMLATIIIGLPLARAFARRMDRKAQVAVAAPDVSPRLDRIEQAIEAVAIEVERISEGQRYATKVMSELRAIPAPNPLEVRPYGGAMKPDAVVEPASERRP